MLRIVGILAVVAVLATAAFGAAAWLPVDGGVVQAGWDGNLVCDPSGINVVAWQVNTYPVLEGVEAVTINGLSSACNGARIMGRVQLSYSDPNNNATWAYTSGTGPYATGYSFVIANGTEATVYTLFLKRNDLVTQWWVPAEDIVGIKVWVEGDTT